MKASSNSIPPAGSRIVLGLSRKPIGGYRVRRKILLGLVLASTVAIIFALWLASKATTLKSELETSVSLVAQLRSNIEQNDVAAAEATVGELKAHTALAREAGSDPVWTAAHTLPWLGPNFLAASEFATSADDLAHFAAAPMVQAFQLLDLKGLTLVKGVIDTAPLQAAQPKLASASYAVEQTSDRLNSVDVNELLPQLSAPLVQARDELKSMRSGLDAAADAAKIAPRMLGAEGTRNYLLMIQNNAEARASGGIPGALAVLTFDRGKLTLGAQSTASEIGVMSPILPVEDEQQQIYSSRIGKFMQDVNLTPDFPTASGAAQAMWLNRTGQTVDGVVSIDPIALSYLLEATGPIPITNSQLSTLSRGELPSTLNSQNLVPALLSDVYAKIPQPSMQDTYFARVAEEIFAVLTSGVGDNRSLFEGFRRGADEGRVLVWSGSPEEQSVIAKYSMSGSIDGPNIAPAQFGVYFNDGTGAKMDYHVKRTVQLIKECARDGYEQTTVRITSTNSAPDDAATSLPAYVTGNGVFGVPPGSVQTNIVAYGPIQANVETAKLDGERTDFAPYLHSDRPVGVLAVRLAPGESKTVEFTFGKIVQHTEPNVVVTPTVQGVNEVVLPVQEAPCGPVL